MENIEVTEIYNKIKELVNENELLRGTKENVTIFNEKIDKVITSLQQTINDLKDINDTLNPSIKLSVHNKKSCSSNKIIALEIFEKMKSGTQITRKLIEVTYDFDSTKSHNIMTTLQKMKGVVNVKDGKTSRLFIQ